MQLKLQHRVFLAFGTLSLLANLVSPVKAQDQDLDTRYRAAITDAMVAENSEILPLHPLTFKDGKTQVVTWFTQAYTPFQAGQDFIISGSKWVVELDELQDVVKQFPKNETPDQQHLRLAELYGLAAPPKTNYDKFAILEVTEDQAKNLDIFRPSSSPSPLTATPGLVNAQGAFDLSFPTDVSLTHVRWFAKQILSSYFYDANNQLDGWPWTRLGYTYNWAPDAKSEYGLSEYVIGNGSKPITVKVLKVLTTDEFIASCQ